MDDFSEDEFPNDDLENEISRIASEDDKAGFVSIMKGLYQSPIPEEEKVGKKEPDTTEAKYCPPVILDWICSKNAVDCATALLEGETGFIVDLNVPLIQGEYPLHVAADCVSYDMTDLFLRHGARTDVRTIDGLFKGGLLPLNVVLAMLSYHRYLVDWTPKQSIFKLIVILCLPQMRKPLELTRLLAWNTKEVNEVFYHYAMEGKLIEMAVLLMVAREKVMALSMFQGKDCSGLLDGRSMTIRQSILKEITLLTDEEVKLMGNSKHCKSVQMLKDKKAVMTLGLLLLELFERDDDAIDTYRQTVQSQMPKQKVAEDIKMLLGEVGFFFKDKDIHLSNIDWESENINLATEVLEKRTAFRSHDLCVPLHSSSGSFCEEKMDEFQDNDLEKEISLIASEDDKAEFVSIMKGLYQSSIPKVEKVGKEEPDTTEAKYCPPVILDWICSHNAVDCATALLEGETGFIVDLNVPFTRGAYPLHVAANCVSYDMTDLFLRYGAQTDVRTVDGLFKGGLLPLNVVLEMLSYHRYLVDWTPKQSIFKLIIILCLPQMRMPLELIRLLAWNTKEVNEVFYHYAMEGKLIEMAVLLMVAREKVMALSMFQGKDCSGLDGSMTIRQSILKEIALLTDEEIKLIMGNSKRCKSVRMLKDKKAVMTLGLLLLEVFERDCDAIDTYRQTIRSQMPKQKVAEDIKMLLGEVGFFLKDKDIHLSNIDCESENIKLATEVLEKRTAFRSHDLCVPLHSSSGSFCEEKNPITNILNERSWSISRFFSAGSHDLRPAMQPYHTLPYLQNGFAPNPIKFPFKNTTTAMKHSAAYFLSSRKFASFALAIKKGITRI